MRLVPCMVEFSPATPREVRRYFAELQCDRMRPDGPSMITQSLFAPMRAPAPVTEARTAGPIEGRGSISGAPLR